MFGVHRSRHVLVMAAVACALAMTGCASSSPTGGSDSPAHSGIPKGDIVFGETLPLSGPLGQTGTFEDALVGDVVAVLNANGGIAGHQVKVITLDDKGDPATALSNAETLIQNDKVAAILNGSLGAGSELTVPYFMKVGVPTVLAESNDSFLDTSKYPSYFTPYASAAQYATEYIAYSKAHGLNDLGTLSDGTPIANQASQDVAAQAAAAGLKVSAEVTYSPTAADLTTQILQLKNAGTKVLLFNGFSSTAQVFAALKQVGWSPIIMGIGAGYATPQMVGSLTKQSFYPCNYFYSGAGGQPTGLAKTALTKVTSTFGVNSTYSSQMLAWYDIVLTLKAGIERANSLNYAAVVKAIESGKPIASIWPGISYTYATTDHEGWPNGALRLCAVTPSGADGVGIVAGQ